MQIWKPSAEDLAAYREDGFGVLRGVYPAEAVEALRAESRRLEEFFASAPELPSGVELAQMESGERRPRRVQSVVSYSPPFREFITAGGLDHIAAGYLGEEASLLLEDRLIYKPPRCLDTYPPHQEWWWTSEYSMRNVMLVVALDASRLDNGPLCVVAGSHKGGLLPHLDDTVPDEHLDYGRAVTLLLEPGDVALIDGGTVHFSQENAQSQTPRTLLLLIYNAASEGDFYEVNRMWTYASRREILQHLGREPLT